MPLRRLLAVLVPLVVPWTVLAPDSGPVTLVFAWGVVDPSVTTLTQFLARYAAAPPDYILAWPISVLCYILAVASAGGGVVTGREDSRVTAGLLACAGVAGLSFAHGLAVQPGRVAYPVGTAVLWAVAWYAYARA